MKLVLLTFLLASVAVASDWPQDGICPVDNKKASAVKFTDAKGYRIYACSADCIHKIEIDPLTYINKMWSKGWKMQKTPTSLDAKSGATHKKKRQTSSTAINANP